MLASASKQAGWWRRSVASLTTTKARATPRRSTTTARPALMPKAPLPKAWSDLKAGFESFVADGDAFRLGVFVDGFGAVFTTDSAHLVAAERNLGLVAVRVDEDVARFQGVGDLCALPDIVRPDVAREPIVRIVRHRHGISDLTVRRDAEDRTEQLVARHRHVRRHVREYGRREEIPFLEAPLAGLVATAIDFRAIRPRFVDFFDDSGQAFWTHQRPELGAIVQGSSHRDFGCFRGKFRDEVVMHAGWHKQACAGKAHLCFARERLRKDAVDGFVPVEVFANDDGSFAAKLEDGRRHCPHSLLENFVPAFSSAGEDDLADSGVLDDRLADCSAAACDDVDGARRESGFVHGLGESQDAEGCHDGGFDDHGVSAGDGGGEAARHELERRVPRNDLADHAIRLPPDVVESGPKILIAALDLSGKAGIVFTVLTRGGDLHPGLSDVNPGVDGFQGCEYFEVAAQQFGKSI